jgi:hypothetical protein
MGHRKYKNLAKIMDELFPNPEDKFIILSKDFMMKISADFDNKFNNSLEVQNDKRRDKGISD